MNKQMDAKTRTAIISTIKRHGFTYVDGVNAVTLRMETLKPACKGSKYFYSQVTLLNCRTLEETFIHLGY